MWAPKKSSKAIVYIHGKGGNAEEAKHYEALFPEYAVYGLAYQGTTPWDTAEEFRREYDRVAARHDAVTVIANSIGAYFAMNALQERNVEKAFFISPIVNMEQLICDMMCMANASEEVLREQGEIETAFGETLSWKYLQYVREHPIHWDIPTEILYAGLDDLTNRDTITAFAASHHAGLCIMENGEHWFHTEEQMAFLDGWLKNLCEREGE